MKLSKILFSIGLIVILSFAWLVNINASTKDKTSFDDCIANAEDSVSRGLYEQGIEFYKKSLEYNKSVDTYLKIKDTYDAFYSEEHTALVREKYIKDMEAATTAYPKCADFWTSEINLYMETENYNFAYKAVNKARNLGADDENLTELYTKLHYMVNKNYKLYYKVKTALNDYMSVYDGSAWTLINGGTESTVKYKMIGLINDSGEGFYTNEIDTRLLDKDEITRARFDINIEDAGCYSDSSKYAPVKIDGKWKYVNLKQEFLPGEFDIAGGFIDHKAAVCSDGKWTIIDDSGKTIENEKFEDIKLDLSGNFIQSDIVIAKENGKYHLYDTSFNQISSFECDDADICIDNNLIAFEKDEKWGFVDKSGNVKLEPTYSSAKSFSNKMAAVCDENNLWGYINSDFKLVIDYQYSDAFYFNSKGISWISSDDNSYQIIKFMFL